MKYTLLILLCIGCTNNLHPVENGSKYSLLDKEQKKIEEDTLHLLWYEIVDSIVSMGNNYFLNDAGCQQLIKKGGKLNKEAKVFKLISNSLSENRTLFFINKIETFTGNVIFSFWEFNNKENINSSDIYTYRYYRYRKNDLGYKNEYIDSVKIYHTDEMDIYSEAFLSACNKWDTPMMSKNEDLLEPMREDVHILAYRLIIKKGKAFTIQQIPVITKSDNDIEISMPPYEIIPEV